MSEMAIPHERLLTALERRLHTATSELAMRDAAIEQLQETVRDLEDQLAAARGAADAVVGYAATGTPASPA